MTSFDICY